MVDDQAQQADATGGAVVDRFLPLRTVARDNPTTAELVEAAVLAEATQAAVEELNNRIRDELRRRAQASEALEGTDWRGVVPGVGQAQHTYAQGSVRVTDAAALAAWLRTNRPTLAEQAVWVASVCRVTDEAQAAQAARTISEAGPRLREDPVAIGAVATLVNCLEYRTEVQVDRDAIKKHFKAVPPNFVDVDTGEALPGIQVHPRRPIGIRVVPDRDHKGRLVRAIRYAITGQRELPQ